MRRRQQRAAPAGALAMLVAAAACAAVPVSGETEGAVPSPSEAGELRGGARPPAGQGTLRQEDVTVTLQAGPLLVKLTPLDERVTELLAPDTQQRLRALAAAHRAAADAVAATPALFLVSYFSYEPVASYETEALQLEHRGRLLRAVQLLSVTGDFGAQRVRQQETQIGIYVFDDAIDYDQPIMVRYGAQRSDAWTRIIPRLEAERIRLRSRHNGISYSLILR